MITRSDLWPPFGLVVTAGDLTLTPVSDDDLPGLVELALAGIHGPERMPFLVPWTTAPPEELPRRYAQHYWEERAAFSGAHCNLDFAVRCDGELVGVQGFSGSDYPVVRTVETGSWLVQRVQGRGIGTRMRQAICAFLFDHLGAAEVTSAAFVDNPASHSVSRKVGYVPNGRARLSRQGRVAVNEKLLLTPEAFVRGVPVEVAGAGPLRRFLGVE